MLQKRVIVCLDVRDGVTTKGVRFQNNVDLGDPVLMAQAYYLAGVDELVFYDITASSERRGIMIDVVRRVAEKIFIPFFTTKKTGSGIGLSLSRQIMRQHQGTLTVKSTVGKGTEFFMRF